MGRETGYQKAVEASCYKRKDLINFGFLIADEKCCWEPMQGARWLGLDWNAVKGTVSVSLERMNRALELLDLLITRSHYGKALISVRLVAAMVGQLLSMQCVMRKVVRLHLRFLHKCISERTSRNSAVVLDKFALDELDFWKKNFSKLNECDFRESADVLCVMECMNVYVDASATGYGDYIDGVATSQVFAAWSALEADSSSTWRVLEAVRRSSISYEDILKGKLVSVKSDSRNACSIMHIGSRKPDLQAIELELETFCNRNDIKLCSIWVPRALNKQADQLSRKFDSDDWSVCDEIYTELNNRWGPYTFDRFAHDYNARCVKFSSRFWCSGTSGLDAFKYSWDGENNWIVPPAKLIAKCIRKIQKEKSARLSS